MTNNISNMSVWLSIGGVFVASGIAWGTLVARVGHAEEKIESVAEITERMDELQRKINLESRIQGNDLEHIKDSLEDLEKLLKKIAEK